MNCYMCSETEGIENVNLYVSGSEGVNLCLKCRMLLVDLIRNIINIGVRKKSEGFKLGRKSKGGSES